MYVACVRPKIGTAKLRHHMHCTCGGSCSWIFVPRRWDCHISSLRRSFLKTVLKRDVYWESLGEMPLIGSWLRYTSAPVTGKLKEKANVV